MKYIGDHLETWRRQKINCFEDNFVIHVAPVRTSKPNNYHKVILMFTGYNIHLVALLPLLYMEAIDILQAHFQSNLISACLCCRFYEICPRSAESTLRAPSCLPLVNTTRLVATADLTKHQVLWVVKPWEPYGHNSTQRDGRVKEKVKNDFAESSAVLCAR